MDNNFDEFENSTSINRRELLPGWIKFFSWLFMILAVIACLTPIQLLFGQVPSLSFYGFHSPKFFPYSLFVIYLIAISNGLIGYMLWFEKDKAIEWGKICAVFGIVACVISFLLTLLDGQFTFRLEIIALVLFYRKLSNLEYNWG